jgi:hypothetical protein
MTYLHLFLYSSLNGCYESIAHGESTLQWSKCIVTNIVFQTMQLSISTKSISKEILINYAKNKVIQLSNNEIVKGNLHF